jgi:tRNA(Ile)-lysidine synthase
MALAALCSQIQQTPYPNLRTLLREDYRQETSGSPLSRNIRFHAFVVDHGVREGSDIEAQVVSQVLEGRDIPTQLLKIDWAGHERPWELPNFETLARKYRFQALGRACRNLGINSLWLAHHEDDIVETVMMRLIAGHHAAGLVGLQPSSEIPECYGLHGVHESGGIDIPAWGGRSISPISTSLALPTQTPSMEPLEIEFGGVRVERPLLNFGKERLIATCAEERMKWFEDDTNKDPKVTMRNAIRHMYTSHALPAAISKPAVLELSRNCRAKQVAKRDTANSWLQQCSIEFETRTATLRVRFPDLSSLKSSGSDIDGKYAAALLLRRIVMLVTPQEHVSVSSLIGAVERVFPECFWAHSSPPPTAFTVAGLYFKVWKEAQNHSAPAMKCEWIICRQPYPSSKPQPRIDIPASLSASADTSWLTWSLYDGRFWIRAQNLTIASMAIRPFCRDDMTDLLSSFPKSNRIELEKHFKKLARDGIAWTLPVIAVKDLDGKEKVLGLPTLGLGTPNVQQMVNWEVRYKKVDMENITTAKP